MPDTCGSWPQGELPPPRRRRETLAATRPRTEHACYWCTRLTNDPAGDFGSAWSPDGTTIAFHSDRDGDFEIYVMDADGAGLAPLTDEPAADVAPAWSPDGTAIVFVSNRDGNEEIYVMNADGTGVARLTADPADDGDPAWSPAGGAP